MLDPDDIATQFEKHLSSPKQTWLLGAGVSFGSNIPLMGPLTDRVLHGIRTDKLKEDEEGKKIIDFLQSDISENANIEEYLTHLGDLISMADRSRSRSAVLGNQSVKSEKLVHIHRTLLELISSTVRWGYKAPVHGENGEVIESEVIGTPRDGIVEVTEHKAFVDAIFGATRAGLEGIRSPVEFFTTNYDTLLEDALALNQVSYQDGFIGGSVAFWNKKDIEIQPSTRAVVTKLHGSIDWYHLHTDPSQLFRVRPYDTYPDNGGGVMIYPQATKYLSAQRDPFSVLFQRFRHRLELGTDQVLLVCGYSFGDEHINAEIESALSTARSQLTVIAFSNEYEEALPETLNAWRNQPEWGGQVFIASPQGLYQGGEGPVFGPCKGEHDWWTFSGVTQLLSQGFGNDILEKLQ